ncbi:MAG: UPF0182 family protein [Bryobacteraceae bacterium]
MARHPDSDQAPARPNPGLVIVLIVIAILFSLSRSIAGYVIDYQWWTELGQVDTWLSVLFYTMLPRAGATLLAALVLWIAHARALKFAGTGLREHPRYARLATLGALALGFIVSGIALDTWTIIRYFGARGLPPETGTWLDPVFAQPLKFYLFDLPFYQSVRSFITTLALVTAIVFWAVARAWDLRYRVPEWKETGEIDVSLLRLHGGLESLVVRGALAIFLLGLAASFYLGRYEMVFNDHSFMVGVDYVDDHIALPMQWLLIACCALGALAVLAGRWILLAAIPAAMVLQSIVPGIVSNVKVKPNEISLQRPYIQKHIEATRHAFGLEGKIREFEFKAKGDARIDASRHRALLDNVRLWDWRAFHDTVTQIQALRPYYTFKDSDVDRYNIGGQLRQILLTPRELDISQLPDARSRWINPTFIYTHGYGVVAAEVAKITNEGLPVLLIQDAPAVVKTPSLKLTRPELYYGEVTHEPVFVKTAQMEFNYPSGDSNVQSKYEGTGGFPISSFLMRLALAVRDGEVNVLLTEYLTGESRVMIHRNVMDRLETLADFILWDKDPYLVISEAGRLVWMVDGFTFSASHPYSRTLRLDGAGRINYMRNAVKATVDAYDGTTQIYVFDPSDPVIRAWQSILPKLFLPASAMPADLRAHARYPETFFRVQTEIFRTFHMKDPQAFYNKEDVWDVARTGSAQGGQVKPMTPTYLVTTMPDSNQPEFLILIPFTPRNKDNLLGLMLGRCDGEKLGELVVLELSKQELIYGPMQVAAQINQDQNISKDLTLWNQQGSQVLRGQIMVLPIENTFLYVEPIYIQATEARMPQLKKVVLLDGGHLIYADTYEQALARLSSGAKALVEQATSPAQPASAEKPGVGDSGDRQRLDRVRGHLRRYRDLSSQGKWAEAGKELESIEAEVGR